MIQARVARRTMLALVLSSCSAPDTESLARPSPEAEVQPPHAGVETAIAPALGAEREASPTLSQTPYPRAAWRLATRAELQRVSLWVSHLLIRHRDVRSHEVSFCKVGWSSLPDPPDRSRQDALALALALADEARRRPGEFAELARRHSEDITSRERGGDLGGVTATNLLRWPEVLDALAAVGVGRTSGVVETEYGFHIFERRAPPAQRVLNAAHIVIGHDRAAFLEELHGRDVFSRTRDAGLALARRVREALNEHPERFSQLVAQFSEHPDAVVQGDLGAWSTWEPTDYSRQLSVLSQLEVGQISEPVETLFGWELLQRTPDRPRRDYAMTAVEIPFLVGSIAADPSAASREQALERATEFARILGRDPGRFDELQREGCCAYVAQWPEGRGWPALMATLQSLEIGQIAGAPVALGTSFLIPKRLPAQTIEPVTATFELPAPSEPDLEALFINLDIPFLAPQLEAIAAAVSTEQQLAAPAASRLRQIHAAALDATIAGSSARRSRYEELQRDLLELLGRQRLEQYRGAAKRQFAKAILQPQGTAAALNAP